MELFGASQLSCTLCSTPVPLNPMAAGLFVDELLVIDNWPVVAPVVEGLNCTSQLIACPALIVIGKLTPETEKALPDNVAALMVTGNDPVDFRVSGSEVVEFTTASPNDRFDGLMLRVDPPDCTGVLETSCITNVFESPPELAVNVTD